MWKPRVTDHFLEGSLRVECGSDSLWSNSTLPWVSGQGCVQGEQVCVWWSGWLSYLPGMIIHTLKHAHPAARWGKRCLQWLRMEIQVFISVLELFLTALCSCCLTHTILLWNPRAPSAVCCGRGDDAGQQWGGTQNILCVCCCCLQLPLDEWQIVCHSAPLFLWWKCSFDRY